MPKGGSLARQTRPPAILAQLSRIQRELLKVESVHEAVPLANQAEALKMLCRKAGLEEGIRNQVAETAVLTQRRAGELLSGSVKEGRKPKLSNDTTVSLPDLGISRDQSSRWQRIASVPVKVLPKHLDEYREAGKELTTASVLRLAAAPKPSRVNDVNDGSFDMVGALDRVRNWVRGLAEEFPEDDRITLICVLRKLADELEGFGVIA